MYGCELTIGLNMRIRVYACASISGPRHICMENTNSVLRVKKRCQIKVDL